MTTLDRPPAPDVGPQDGSRDRAPEGAGGDRPDHGPDLLRSLGGTATAAFAGWVVLLSWRGLAEDPGRITVPLFVGAVLIAVTGWAVRRWSGRVSVAVVAQVLVLLVWTLQRVLGTWLPTPGNVRTLVLEVGDGILASQRYYSPVPVEHPEFHLMLTMAGLGIILLIDLLACGWRQPALAGLPMLLTVTVAASILIDPLDVWIFAASALLWMVLIALREADRLGAWSPTGLAPTALVIGLVSVLVAAFVTAGLGSEGRLFQNTGGGDGDGPGDSLDIANPLLDMRRNLRQPQDVPVIDVQTPNGDGEVPAYVRLSVLDAFSGAAWFPTTRESDRTAPVEGELPFPTGLARSAAGPDKTWVFNIESRFRSSWLPLPVPTSSVDVGSDWRVDPDTLDVSSASDDAGGMRYRADTFDVTVDPTRLRAAGQAPAAIRRQYTSLPRLPSVFRETANEVVAGADNDWDRAVLLQQWFRSDGNFTYSLEPDSGNGISTLEKFITTDKVGYCEQFATAMATMARTLGIPARVSVGFLRSTETDDDTYTFSTQDLHAWPELYFPGAGWTRFEPTPGGRTGNAPDYTDQEVAPAPAETTAPTPTEQPTTPTDVPSEAAEDQGAGADGGAPWWVWPAGLAGFALVGSLVALPWLLRRERERRRWARATDPRALADAAWEDVRETSLDLGLGWSETASVRVNGRQVQESVHAPEAREALGEVVRIVELTRYAGAHGAGPVTRDQLRADVERWRAAAYDTVDPRTARRARWWPRPR